MKRKFDSLRHIRTPAGGSSGARSIILNGDTQTNKVRSPYADHAVCWQVGTRFTFLHSLSYSITIVRHTYSQYSWCFWPLLIRKMYIISFTLWAGLYYMHKACCLPCVEHLFHIVSLYDNIFANFIFGLYGTSSIHISVQFNRS